MKLIAIFRLIVTSLALGDKYVCGVRDNQLKSTFLKQSSLTFSQACDIALSWEMAEGETREMASRKDFNNTCQVKDKVGRSNQNNFKKLSKPCGRCGKSGHNSDQCLCKSWVCFNCNKKGHIATNCFLKKKGKTSNQVVKAVEEIRNAVDITHIDESVYQVTGSAVCKAKHIKLVLNDKIVEFDVNTEACATIISKVKYVALFKDCKLE